MHFTTFTLLLASMVFYAFHHWPSVFLLVGTIAVNYAAGRALEKSRSRRLLAAVVLFGFFGITSTSVVSGTIPLAVTPVRAP